MQATGSKTKRGVEVLLLLALYLIVGSAYVWVRSLNVSQLRAPNGRYVLADPDSYMRWRFVKRALDGESVRIRWTTADNAPYGRAVEWTSPMTILGVFTVRAFEILGRLSRDQALMIAGLWVGPIIGLFGLAALGWLGWRAGGWPLAACWMVAWPALKDGLRVTSFGNTDHHGLHQFLFICMMGGCLAWAQNATIAGGIFVGLASATGMWSAGSELLPAWALVSALAVYEMMQQSVEPARIRFWRAWWLSGLTGTCAAWLFEFWPHVFHGHLELLSIWHVILWVICGALLESLHRACRTRAKQLLAIISAIAAAVFAAGLARRFDWAQIHVMQDKLFRHHLELVIECQPFLSLGLQGALLAVWCEYGLLPVVLLMGLASRSSTRRGARENWLLLVTVVFLSLMFYQIRWGQFFVVGLVMTASLAIRNRWATSPWLCVAALAWSTLPSWLLVGEDVRNNKLVQSKPEDNRYLATFAMQAVSECLARQGDQPIALVNWDTGSILAGMGKVRVIGSGYWYNIQGLQDMHEMFTTTSSQRFWQLVELRHVQFFIAPPPMWLKADIRDSFLVLERRRPSEQEIQATVAWQIATIDRYESEPCDRLAETAPEWKILRLQRHRSLKNQGFYPVLTPIPP